MKSKIIILLLFLFIVLNGIAFMITKYNGEQRIQLVLEDNLNTLQTHYEILLHAQELTALALYQATIETIFKRCDDALYLAKENGRNRVESL